MRLRNAVLHVALLAMPFVAGCRLPVVDSGHAGIVFKSLGQGTSKTILGEGLHVMPIWNSVIAAETMTGRDGNTLHALPHDQLLRWFKHYGRLP